jgi:hypothetical protein
MNEQQTSFNLPRKDSVEHALELVRAMLAEYPDPIVNEGVSAPDRPVDADQQ